MEQNAVDNVTWKTSLAEVRREAKRDIISPPLLSTPWNGREVAKRDDDRVYEK